MEAVDYKGLTYKPDYLSEMKQLFRCRVPMEGIRQIFLVDGVLQEGRGMQAGVIEDQLALQPGADGKGLTLHITGDHSQTPVQLIGVRKENLPEPLVFTNQWVLEDGAQAQLVVCDHTLEDYPYETERHTHIYVGNHAKLDILFMQNEHKTSTFRMHLDAHLGEGAQLDCHILSLYGGIIQNNIDIVLDKPHTVCNLNGLFLVDGTQRIDTTVNLVHQVGNCTSSQLFKGILDNDAKATFYGLIKVVKDAQKTEAYQANHNLLLSKTAKITTRPQLEIYADDVKCSHGATIGRMDELGLFYLRSRGIPLQEAQMLQQMAFVQDVLGKIRTTTIRERLEHMVESRLRGEFSKCSHCTMHCC